MAKKKTIPNEKKTVSNAKPSVKSKTSPRVTSISPVNRAKQKDSTHLQVGDSIPAKAEIFAQTIKLNEFANLKDKTDSLVSNGPEQENSVDYAKSKDKKKPPRIIEFKDILFCPDRIKDHFMREDYDVENFNDNDFLIERVDIGRLFVRVNSEMPLIRLLIPVFFRKKMSRTKRYAWCCEVMSKYPVVRICFDDPDEDDDVFMCLDYDYSVNLDADQLVYSAECLSMIAQRIYMDYPEILDSEIFGIDDDL